MNPTLWNKPSRTDSRIPLADQPVFDIHALILTAVAQILYIRNLKPFPFRFSDSLLADNMIRSIHYFALFGMLFFLGCGKAEVADSTPTAVDDATPIAKTVNRPSPVDVVSQFLDQIRRGGEDSGASSLLTEKARSELKRIGRSIEPMGSPDARYEVTRAQMVPGEEGSALVHSIWTDPNSEGGQSNYQVVWAVVQETVGWRISGMAIQEDESQEPVIIDFENGDLMAKVLGGTESGNSQTPAATQAATSQEAAIR